MSFVLSKMLWAVLRPSALLVLLATLGALRGPGRGGRTLLWLGLGGLLAVMLLPLDRWALRPLEDRFAPAALPAWVDGIIVLGGAVETRLSADRDRPSLNGAAERMTEFVTLARRYPQARLVFTGGNGLLEGGTPEAASARALFQSLGVAPERLEFESASRTTWDNAVFSHDLLHPQQGEVWVLVTSASHMPRAMGAFRQAGWPVLPWPVAYKSLSRAAGWLPDSGLAERLLLLDWAAHEWAGMLAYWLMDRSDAPFPAPLER